MQADTTTKKLGWFDWAKSLLKKDKEMYLPDDTYKSVIDNFISSFQ